MTALAFFQPPIGMAVPGWAGRIHVRAHSPRGCPNPATIAVARREIGYPISLSNRRFSFAFLYTDDDPRVTGSQSHADIVASSVEPIFVSLMMRADAHRPAASKISRSMDPARNADTGRPLLCPSS